jgi:chromosome segregation ATPase
LGKYTWIADRATVKFIAPVGFQFGDVVPPAAKTIEESKEVLTYDVAPINLENLTAIKEGLPVRLEYAKYDEMTITEMKTAREFIEEAEFDLLNANKSIENAKIHIQDTTQILTLFEIASTTLDEAKNARDLAQIKSNQYSAEYSPYEAYHYAKESRTLAREASRKAEESKDLANYEIQRALEEKISGIGSKLREQSDTRAALTSEIDKPPEAEESPWTGYGLAVILILAAVVIFDIYRRSGGLRRAPAFKKSTVRDFRAIGELKHKSFKGFDKKLDTVKHGTELATKIRALRKKKEELEFERGRLERKREKEEIQEHQFEMDKEKLDREINDITSKIDEHKARLNELKKVSG